MSDLNRRNTEGVVQALKRVESKLANQEVVLNQFSGIIGDLMTRLALLERAEVERKIASMGQGPTEK